MIYAGEQGVLLPTVDLYDTGLMQSAIRAAKDKYDEAKALKDELDTYNDFSSPFKKDVQWYNEKVKDPIKTGIDQLYAQGIDPLRTALGRAALANLKRSLPLDKVAELKRNATAGEVYLKNKAALDKAGLYDEEFQKYNGIDFGGFSTYDRDGNLNMWNYESPVALQSIRDILDPIVGKIKPTYDEAKSKNDPQHRKWSTITMDRLMGAIKDAQYDLEKNPSWRYYKNVLMRNTEEDPNRFNNIVKDRLSPYTHEDYVVDPVWATRMAHSGSGNGNGNLTQSLPRFYSDKIKTFTRNKFNTQLQNTFGNISEYFDEQIKAHTNIEQNKRVAPDQSIKWSKIKSDYAKATTTADKKKVLTRAGLIDKEGNYTRRFYDFQTRSFINKMRHSKNGGLHYWNANSYAPSSDEEKSMFMHAFAGTTKTQKYLDQDLYTITFGNGVNLATSRYAGLLGKTGKLPKIYRMFNQWLSRNKVQGLVDNSPIDLSRLEQGDGTTDTDFRGTILLPEKALRQFAKQQFTRGENVPDGGDEFEKRVQKLVNDLGLRKRTMYDDAENERIMYVLPAIRTTKLSPDDLNQRYEKELYGQQIAELHRILAENAAYDYQYGTQKQ